MENKKENQMKARLMQWFVRAASTSKNMLNQIWFLESEE